MAKDQKTVEYNDDEILHRALSYALEALQAARVQAERARADTQGDGGAGQWWIDLQFFIVALRRVRRSVEMAERIRSRPAEVVHALAEFDGEAPLVVLLRDVGEHIDAYALDVGRNESVTWRSVQQGQWDGKTVTWLDRKLDVDAALKAAQKLVGRLEEIRAVFLESADEMI